MSDNGSTRRLAPQLSADSRSSDTDESCDSCSAWELRYLVAVRASYYLTLYVASAELRDRVLDHVTAAYTLRFVGSNGVPGDFQTFFEAYCEDVERDIDPAPLSVGDHPAEYKRVWTNHAYVLGGRPDLVQPRFEMAA